MFDSEIQSHSFTQHSGHQWSLLRIRGEDYAFLQELVQWERHRRAEISNVHDSCARGTCMALSRNFQELRNETVPKTMFDGPYMEIFILGECKHFLQKNCFMLE